jgi:hypothetical protein
MAFFTISSTSTRLSQEKQVAFRTFGGFTNGFGRKRLEFVMSQQHDENATLTIMQVAVSSLNL